MGDRSRDTVRTPAVDTLDVPHQETRLSAQSRHAHFQRGIIELYDEPSVAGRMELLDVAWLRLARITAKRHVVLHEPRVTSARAIAFILQISGRSILRQRGHTAQLAPRQWSLADPALYYTLMSPAASRRIVLLIPRERLVAGADIACLTGRAFSGSLGLGRLAMEFCTWLVEEFAAMSTEWTERLAVGVTQLVNLAIQEQLSAADELPRNAIEDRVRLYVAEHLRDPQLSPARIAAHLKRSKRSLYRAMQGTGRSVHELIWHERLDRCRRDLLDPTQAGRSIGEIACSWGFKNLTHFSQAFRTRFGVSPRNARSTLPRS